MERGRDYDDRYRGREDEYWHRRDGDFRRSRYDDRREHDYQGMYDDYTRSDDDRRRSRTRTRDPGDFERGDDYRHHHHDDHGRGHRPRSASRSRTRDAGRPSDTVILEGLPHGVPTSAIRRGLFDSSIAGDFSSVDVRVTASRGNCRAFVQFATVEDASAFVKQHFPKLLICLPHSTDDVPDGKFTADIHFARSQGYGDAPQTSPATPAADWACPTCGYFNFASRSRCKKCSGPSTAEAGDVGRTGAADVGRDVDQKVQILVVYPLPPDIDEQKLASEMKRLELVKQEKPKDEAPKLKSTAPSADGAGFGARPGSLHRVFLMRDLATGEKFPYGFAEFWTLNDALSALKKYQMTRSFEIANTPVTIASIHLGVFVPEYREVTPELEDTSFKPLFNPSLRVKYRDPELYPSQLVVAATAPEDDEAVKAAKEKTEGQKPKKRKAEESLPESATKKAPVMAAQMAFWQRRHEEIRGGGPQEGAPQSSAANGPSRTAPIKFSLSGATTKPGSAVAKAPRVSEEPEKRVETETAEVSYVDRERLACLLCMMRYKSVEDVNTHEKSGNHKRAMQDEEKVQAALPRLAARDKRRQKAEAAQYRDRAKERREAHNQPDKPKASKPKAEGKPQAKEEAKKPAESKGAGMLAKMGWTSGNGLGAQGDGLTEALTASAYKGGVGLGVEGGKLGDAAEVAESRTTDSYSSYLTAAQQKARERYNQME
ncbi:hypothetical protein CDD83_7918 [Cordyceps sp. RAO-2017]|nr:hypothetical protein CDD83_7918 [Cordyceps sp. RAO-2017]